MDDLLDPATCRCIVKDIAKRILGWNKFLGPETPFGKPDEVRELRRQLTRTDTVTQIRFGLVRHGERADSIFDNDEDWTQSPGLSGVELGLNRNFRLQNVYNFVVCKEIA